VALVIRGGAVAAAATRHVEQTMGNAAYRLERRGDTLSWRAPPGAPFKDEDSEPGASTKLKLLVRLLGSFAPDEML